MKNIKAIIFDFDGVVVDSEHLYEETGHQLFRQYGIKVSEKDWQIFKGLTAKDFFNTLIQRYNLKVTPEELAEADHKILKQKFRAKLAYIPGFQDFLKMVKNDYKLALVTSTSSSLLNWIFENTKVNRDFELILTADDVDHHKPHPMPYLSVAKKLQICPTEMLVIEDSVNGVVSAKSAGSKVVGFLTSFIASDLCEADYHAANYRELSELIKNIGS
ncbi:MAG: HAD family hydrolase [Fidelibacterota bacterium]